MSFYPDEPLRFADFEIGIMGRFRVDSEFFVISVLRWVAGKTIDASSLKVELNTGPGGGSGSASHPPIEPRANDQNIF